MAFNPEVTVAAVVERDARFLLVEERISGRLVLNQPAGHLEDRETLLDAVIRETREETAWRFAPSALVGTYLWRSPDAGRTFLRFAFCGTVDDFREGQALDVGIVRTVWLTHEHLLAQQARLRSPLVLRCIDDYLLGRRQPLDSVAALDLETAPRVHAVVNL
jgi:8-oxo-dGTP pyrophosphatase MutT (NUDIX family)